MQGQRTFDGRAISTDGAHGASASSNKSVRSEMSHRFPHGITSRLPLFTAPPPAHSPKSGLGPDAPTTVLTEYPSPRGHRTRFVQRISTESAGRALPGISPFRPRLTAPRRRGDASQRDHSSWFVPSFGLKELTSLDQLILGGALTVIPRSGNDAPQARRWTSGRGGRPGRRPCASGTAAILIDIRRARQSGPGRDG